MAAILIPNWKFIVFLTAVYVLSALLHLDPNVVHQGGGAAITSFSLTAFDVLAFIAAIVVGLVAAALVSAAGKWAGAAAFVVAFIGITAVSGTWDVFLFLASVVTFSDLGLPLWLQFLIAVPCLLLFIWTALAFISAVLGIGREVSG